MKKINLKSILKKTFKKSKSPKKIKTKFGFAQHPNEWWHFSYGDQLWAWKNKKANALYGKI